MFRTVSPPALAALLLALPATAQDAGEALDRARAVLVTGDIAGDEMPATDLMAEGCVLTFTTRSASPDIEAPIRLTNTADATTLDFENWSPISREGQITLVFPSTQPVTFDMVAEVAEGDAGRETFTGRIAGATCTQTECSGSAPAPGFAVVAHGATLGEANAARDALRDFAAACASAEEGAANEEGAATGEDAPSPAFAALRDALAVGTEGDSGSSTLTRGAGCNVVYGLRSEFDGAPFDASVRVDLGKVRPDEFKIKPFDQGTNIEMRAERDAEDVWDGEITGSPDHADQMKKLGATCDATICRAVIDRPHPTLSLVGPDQQARAEAAVAAIADFRAECME